MSVLRRRRTTPGRSPLHSGGDLSHARNIELEGSDINTLFEQTDASENITFLAIGKNVHLTKNKPSVLDKNSSV